MPLSLGVFDRVRITPPLTDAEITASLDNTNPPGGNWYQITTLTVVSCPDPFANPSGMTYEGWNSNITFSDNRDSMTISGGWNNPIPLSRISENIYQGTGYNEYGDPTYITVTFSSRTTYDISSSANFYNGTCGYNYDGSGEFRG